MREYFVEVTPGRVLLYRTPLALRAAMQTGEISADSRIFHRATSSWISITEHPEYRRFQGEVEPRDSFAPRVPQEPVELPPTPHERGRVGGLAEMVALVTSVWGSLKSHFVSLTSRVDSDATKSVRPPERARPSRPASTPASSTPASPVQPVQRPEPRTSDPTRDRWTFYP